MLSHVYYQPFTINVATRSWIITLGIRKQPINKQYHRSQAGRDLFHRICSVHSRWNQHSDQGHKEHNQVKLSNLIRHVISNDRSINSKLSVVNARSIYNKLQSFQNYVQDNITTICAITETWLSNDENDHRYKEIPPPGYKILSKPCKSGRKEGSIAMVYKALLNMKECPTSSQNSEIMEYMELTTNFKDIVCNIYIIYHIPNTRVIQLCSELSDLMENNILEDCGHIIMLGDFNIHMDKPEQSDTVIFNDFLESFDLINFTTFPTHISKHTLDLVITSFHRLIKSIGQGHFLSDHCFVDVTLHVSRTELPKMPIKFHKLKNANSALFHIDLRDCLENQSEQPDDQVKQNNTKLCEVLHKHAPIIEKKIRDSHYQPWFNDRIKSEIVLRRKKERIWLKDQAEYSLNAFYVQCRHIANFIKTAQHSYYKEIIHESHIDYKAIFSIANSLLFRKSDSPMPDIKPLSTLAEGFNEFFYIKITKIMDKFKLNVYTQNLANI